jgi:hypothetical protein
MGWRTKLSGHTWTCSGRKLEPLRSAESAPASDADRQHPDLIPGPKDAQTTPIRDLEVQQQSFRTAMNQHPRLISSKDLAPGSVGDGRMRSCNRPNRRSPQQRASGVNDTTVLVRPPHGKIRTGLGGRRGTQPH